MTLAAAAAIALGIFLPGTKDTSIPTNNHYQEQAMLAQAGESAAATAQAVTAADAPAQEAAPETAAVRRSARKAVTEPAATQEPVTAGTQPVETAGPKDTGTRNDGPAAGTVRDDRVPDTDPFAELTTEKPVRKAVRRPALYAQGAVGGNESTGRPLPPAARMAPGTSDNFSEQGTSSYGIPFTIGLGIRFYVAPRLSLGTGLDYSLLTRTFTGNYQGTSGSVAHTLQYLGVPLNLYYDIIDAEKIRFYAYGGGELEYCISNKYKFFASPDIIRKYPVDKLQYSVGAGLGVEFRLSQHLGLYLDPGMQYYFPGNQPKSIRTEKPLMVNFDAGLRLNF